MHVGYEMVLHRIVINAMKDAWISHDLGSIREDPLPYVVGLSQNAWHHERWPIYKIQRAPGKGVTVGDLGQHPSERNRLLCCRWEPHGLGTMRFGDLFRTWPEKHNVYSDHADAG